MTNLTVEQLYAVIDDLMDHINDVVNGNADMTFLMELVETYEKAKIHDDNGSVGEGS